MVASTRTAWTDAVALLARRALTRHELGQRLRARGHSEDAVEQALEQAESCRYLDDRSVAYNLARRRAAQGRHGPSRVRLELLSRGLEPTLATEALNEYFGPQQLPELVRRAAGRLQSTPAPKERERLKRRLIRRGFPAALIDRTLNSTDACQTDEAAPFADGSEDPYDAIP